MEDRPQSMSFVWISRTFDCSRSFLHRSLLLLLGVLGVSPPKWSRDVVESARGQPYHHRILFETIGRPLGSHVDQPELIRVMRDALIGASARILTRIPKLIPH